MYDIGYWCDTTQQGHGYVTEAAQALTNYALDELDAQEIVIRIASGNTKSQGVPKRLGFTMVRTQPSITLPGATDHVYTYPH